MPEHYSRRSFLAGAVTAGMLSSAAGYVFTRREPITLTLATGADPTGARALLVNLWNELNPEAKIFVAEVNSSTQDQYNKFVETKPDIYNLDIIHIPRFVAAGLIVAVTPQNDISLLPPVKRVCQKPGTADELWAVPFNADVGMLYRRIVDKRTAGPEPNLKSVLADSPTQLVGQLGSVGTQTDEAFVVNVLEHALAQDDAVLGEEGIISFSLGQWRAALAPLAEAIQRRNLRTEAGEDDTTRTFQRQDLRYMRNWPVNFPAVDRAERSEVGTAEIRLGRLPVGILGGQSLAIAADCEHRSEAERAIRFLTDAPAQKLLAISGFAPTGLDAYIDPGAQASTPQLSIIRYAVEASRPRPIHRNYALFASRFKNHTYAYLHQGEQLTQRFIQDIQEALQ